MAAAMASTTASAWRLISRPLQYKAGGGAAVDVAGVLVSPSAEDLVGDLDETAQTFICLYADLEAATGTTSWATFDRVIDGSRTFNVAEFEIGYQGSSPAWFTAEVVG